MFVNDFLKLNKFTYFGVLSVVSQKGLSSQKQGLAGGGLRRGGLAWKVWEPLSFLHSIFNDFILIFYIFLKPNIR